MSPHNADGEEIQCAPNQSAGFHAYSECSLDSDIFPRRFANNIVAAVSYVENKAQAQISTELEKLGLRVKFIIKRQELDNMPTIVD